MEFIFWECIFCEKKNFLVYISLLLSVLYLYVFVDLSAIFNHCKICSVNLIFVLRFSLQVFLAYFSPGPENFPGHVEEYDVLCPPSSPGEDIEEDNMEEDLTAMEQDSERDAYFTKLQLLTKEKNERIIEVGTNFCFLLKSYRC